MKRVGYWIPEKKRKKLNFEDSRELFRNAGIDIVQIDPYQPLTNQGPFDLLVHKLVEVLAAANAGHEASVQAIHNIETYLSDHPKCIMLDPLDSVRTVLDRHTQYQKVLHSHVMNDPRCMIPTFVELTSTDVGENKEKLAKAGVTFPLVIKPNLAHGSNLAHEMSIIFNEQGLHDISSAPCVAMSFVNHNAILYKIMVVGCRQFIVQRPSLKNLYPGDQETVFFDTQQVSKADSDHPLNSFDHASLEDQPVKPDWKYLDRLGQAIRGAMQLDLFGFDVIIDSESMQYGIIDINFFPGFEAIDSFFPFLVDHIKRVLEARDQDQLVNGRLMPSAADLNSELNIQNQLNRNQRRENAVNKERQPVSSCSPIIDLSPRSQLLANAGDNNSDSTTKVKNVISSTSTSSTSCDGMSLTNDEDVHTDSLLTAKSVNNNSVKPSKLSSS